MSTRLKQHCCQDGSNFDLAFSVQEACTRNTHQHGTKRVSRQSGVFQTESSEEGRRTELSNAKSKDSEQLNVATLQTGEQVVITTLI